MYGADRTAVQITESVTGSLSLIASLYCFSQLKKEKTGRYSLTDSMLIVLIIVDVVTSIMYAIGSVAYLNNGFCQFQATVIQWFSLAGIFWLACNGYQLYKWIVLKKNSNGIRKKLKRYASVCFILSGIISFSLLGTGAYGDAYMWCWIRPVAGENYVLRFLCFYIFLVIAWVYNAIVLGSISFTINKRVQAEIRATGKASELTTAESQVSSRLRVYLLVFIISWVFSLLASIAESIANQQIFLLNFLTALFVPSQGLLNSIVYGGIFQEGSVLHEWIEKNWNSLFVLMYPKTALLRRQTSFAASAKRIIEYAPKKYSIFTTTLNMGEAPTDNVKPNLHTWILKGHDIYVVGVQECLEIESLREAILQHLGGPSEYVMYGDEIGSNNTSLGFHGYIGLSVFLKASGVQDGSLKITESSLRTVAAGANLLVTTAANKGGVGFPIQIHDTSIAFCTAHLPSDSKGVSKLAKRNAAAGTVLREMCLVANDYGFDVHLQHDHYVFLGDLNYRMDVGTSDVSSLTAVSIAARIERSAYNEDPQWLQRRYCMLYGKDQPEYPSDAEMAIIKRGKEASVAAWSAVLGADELCRLLKENKVFSGFCEAFPGFPPSYKRLVGDVASDCGDYTDVEAMIKGYHNTGESLADDEDDEDCEVGSENMTPNNSAKVTRPVSVSRAAIAAAAELERTAAAASVKLEKVAVDRALAGEIDMENGEPVSASPVSARRGKGRRVSVVMQLPPTATKKEIKAIRPPSYTDRILVHSLPDRKEKIQTLAYDICDQLRVSDHRAVTTVLELEVNSKIKSSAPSSTSSHDVVESRSTEAGGGRNSLLSPISQEHSSSAFPLAGTSMEFFELIVNNLYVQLDGEHTNLTNNVQDVQNPLQAGVNGDIESSTIAPPPPPLSPVSVKRKKRGVRGSIMALTNNIMGDTSDLQENISEKTKVHHVTVVCPLPSKDPLVNYRDLYDLSHAMKISTKDFMK